MSKNKMADHRPPPSTTLPARGGMTVPHLDEGDWRGGSGMGDEPGKMAGRPAPGGNSVPRGREPMPRSTTTAAAKADSSAVAAPMGLPSLTDTDWRGGNGMGDEPGKGGTMADRPTGTVVPERRGASDGYKLMRDRR